MLRPPLLFKGGLAVPAPFHLLRLLLLTRSCNFQLDLLEGSMLLKQLSDLDACVLSRARHVHTYECA